MKKYLWLFGLIFVLMIAACAQQVQETSGRPEAVAEEVADAQAPPLPPPPAGGEAAKPSVPGVVEIDMVAKQWEFTSGTIVVKEGDRVILHIQNIDVPHGFAIFEFGVNEKLPVGKTTTVEFTADKKGEYTFFCSVPCGRGHSDMKGTLRVE